MRGQSVLPDPSWPDATRRRISARSLGSIWSSGTGSMRGTDPPYSVRRPTGRCESYHDSGSSGTSDEPVCSSPEHRQSTTVGATPNGWSPTTGLRRTRSQQGEAGVDLDLLAGQPLRLFGHQERDRVGDVLRLEDLH